jgi:DNA replication protein DnaC
MVTAGDPSPPDVGRLLEHIQHAEEHQRARPARDVNPLHVTDIEELADPDLGSRYVQTWSSAMPARFLAADLADFDGDPAMSAGAYESLCEWSAAPGQRNLIVYGAVGTGKTHAVVAAVRAAHMRGCDVRFLPSVELLDLLRPPNDPALLYELAEVDVLVVDDLGAQRDTEWTDERLYALINRRWLETLPTVVTTNLDSKDEMAAAFGERVFSRLRHGAVVFHMVGNDRRARRRDG